MVDSRVTDGERIAELLAAEIEGCSDGGLGRLSVTNVDTDAEPGHHSDRIFDVVRVEKPHNENAVDGPTNQDATEEPSNEDATEEPSNEDATERPSNQDTTGESSTESPTDELLATAHVHDDRIHLALRIAQEMAHERAAALDLRTRPKATTPPQTLVFVESGAEVKRAVQVLSAVGESFDVSGE